MSTERGKKWNRQVGFKLEDSQKRQRLEEIRVSEGYPNLTEFMRDLVDEKIQEYDS